MRISSQVLSHGWDAGRYFPVQMIWNDLQSRQRSCDQIQNDDLKIEVTFNSTIAASMFVECFLDQWAWYFERMGYNARAPSRSTLDEIALLFVQGADAYFIASVDGKPLGINSVILPSNGTAAEFHTGVGVLPKGRGRNIGTRLVDFSLDWLQIKGAKCVEIRTQEVAGGLTQT